VQIDPIAADVLCFIRSTRAIRVPNRAKIAILILGQHENHVKKE
jgi:hypothetical protein